MGNHYNHNTRAEEIKMKRVVVISDSDGDVYRVLPVADTFTRDDLEVIREKVSHYSHDANLYDLPERTFCVGEIQQEIAEYNSLGKCW
jgi:hypothetical protein